MGRPAQAEQSFLAALVRFPNNGWALFGLAEAQRRQGDAAGARATDAALERAWLGEDRNPLQLSRL
jgi:TolA-binding protein